MKNYYRIYGILMLLITGIFVLFEVSALSFSFNMAFNRELENVQNANIQFSNALSTSIEMLEAESIVDNSVVLNYVSDNIYKSMNNHAVTYIVSNYPDTLYTSRLIDINTNRKVDYSSEDNWYIEHFKTGEKHYIQVTNRLEISGDTLYVKTVMDIAEIYSERDAQVSGYRIVIFAIFILFAVGLYLLIKGFEKNIRIAERLTQIELASRRQEEFSASFAHECRTPLTSIIGYSDMLRSTDLSEEEQKESAEYIFSEGKRLERLTKQMMLLSNIRDEKITKESIDVKKLLNKVLKSVERKMEENKIVFNISVEEGTLIGAEDLYQSMLINILDNARKAVSQNGEISLIGKNNFEVYEIAIVDNGCGMNEETIEKMTQPFYMADKARTRKEGGAGLGMAIVNQIAKRSNVKMQVKSTLGHGTRIILKIPRTKEENNEK
ncbi:sensor histidine kinase [Clostridium grantii]|uniref:histidine kinase n=1 Tax=Clostridium grantii DSM 8605 TaxID=1121316 RepID=A0A1M5SYR4_9CLOT|nr:HAMP domain-containing sensor histidine kinase [Clostridium grantii]SHH43500.1 His Kinase A (phospho-acceptor) domain-containing protein [Clostridium grantii DSM 8605]